jgi:hypothetical protein
MVSNFVYQYEKASNTRYLKEKKEEDVKTKNSMPILEQRFRQESLLSLSFLRGI